MRKTLLAVFLAALAVPALAEVYAWRDAAGKKRMSNVAPAWYSETGRTSPRIQVLVNGIVVDDTGLPEEQRAKLREGRANAEAWGMRTLPAAARVVAPGVAPVPVKPAVPERAAPPPLPPMPTGLTRPPVAEAKK